MALLLLSGMLLYSGWQLNLYDNGIDPEGASALAESLKVNASLTQVLAFCSLHCTLFVS